ncbi:Urease accessory protein UreD [Frankliniella fusca]|uniref:Urease accessory protein UreD n=1 Tax=Frankliniella fusca TaxID=407009 RepID=A0AAE1LTI0_9NEOP|nr:Urease accessory protein UreD [Frankliniella fusca]
MEAQVEALQQQIAHQNAVLAELGKQLEAEKQKKLELPANLLNLLCGNSTPPPKPFSFRSEDWTEWITRFEQYRTTTPLQYMEEDQQVSKMLYYMGGKANDILNTFKLTEEEKKSLSQVQRKFNSHYVTKKTKLYIRARFNTREQKEGESADEFITDLQTLGKKCEFNTMTDELIRDRLVVGIHRKNKGANTYL